MSDPTPEERALLIDVLRASGSDREDMRQVVMNESIFAGASTEVCERLGGEFGSAETGCQF